MQIVIDTDAGVDDAVALMLALAHPTAHLHAITTVTGNIGVDQVIRNVMDTLAVMKRDDVPVFRGAALPLVAPWQHETVNVHGVDGFGDWAARPNSRRQPEPEHAVLTLLRLADRFPGELTLIALGPLTNIALAVRLDPAFPSKIRQLIWMGGAIYGYGNTDPFTAEFNIHIDPEAAYIVLNAFPESTMIAWEIAMKHEWLWADFDLLAALKAAPAAKAFRGITAHWRKIGGQIPTVRGFVMPDPLAMAAALYPEIVRESAFHHVAVELNGTHTRGSTPVDFPRLSGKAPNVHIVMEVDQAAFYDLYRTLLTKGTL
ncbi:MAG: nucleoside hydrolase [bacterium]|nr:nucleoside hydrolase [bacterium]